jgi:geranylgeranyl pyrophosphate synthase
MLRGHTRMALCTSRLTTAQQQPACVHVYDHTYIPFAVMFGWCSWAFCGSAVHMYLLLLCMAVADSALLCGGSVVCQHQHVFPECLHHLVKSATGHAPHHTAVCQQHAPAHAGQAVRFGLGQACNTLTCAVFLPRSAFVPCSDITERQRRLAEIIEMIHTASLVHDDVLDDCSVRRGGLLRTCSICGRTALVSQRNVVLPTFAVAQAADMREGCQ